MKKLILLFAFTALVSGVQAQSAALCPLNVSGMNLMARQFSAPQHDVLWIGFENAPGAASATCKKYARTINAGASFTIDSVPETANRSFTCIASIDAQTAWAGLQDWNGIGGGAIWKTTNGGQTWNKVTNNNEFVGGFLDFLYFFSPDSGIAFGDPNGGYYEIYTTSNGGISWTRVPQANIPQGLSNEFGLYGNFFSAAQNSIWCLTNQGRVYFSSDKGYHWQVTQIQTGVNNIVSHIAMTDSLNGVACEPPFSNSIYKTSNGGVSWTTYTANTTINISRVAAIKNTPGAFVFLDPFAGIYATTDNFATTYPISTNANILMGFSLVMVDASIGYTNPVYTITDSALIRISNDLTGINTVSDPSELSALNVFPNPVQTGYSMVSFNLAKAGTTSARIKLLDLSGKELKEEIIHVQQGQNASIFDFTGLAKGMYMLQLNTEKSTSTTRVLIE